MQNYRLKQQIEELRAEMIRIMNGCNSFTDQSVVAISQKLDSLLNDYTKT